MGIQIVVAVIADPEGRVLLVRKRGSIIFIQPGGKRESGEESLVTLARELREELGVGIVAESVYRLGEFEDWAVHEQGQRVRAEAFVLTVDTVPQPSAEIEELAWISPQPPYNVRVAPLSAQHILPAYREHVVSTNSH